MSLRANIAKLRREVAARAKATGHNRFAAWTMAKKPCECRPFPCFDDCPVHGPTVFTRGPIGPQTKVYAGFDPELV